MIPMSHTAESIQAMTRREADPKRAEGALRYFKTGPGQSGEGQRFLGMTSGGVMAIVKQVWRDMPDAEILKLLASPFHEERGVALLIWREQFQRADEMRRTEICEAYLANAAAVNNWALVDSSAPFLLGPWLEDHPRGILSDLARSPLIWERRIAIVSTLHLIRIGQFADTFDVAELLLGDREDLIHKAVGWMLREVGNRDEALLCGFLDRHYSRIPRTALRYAIERMPDGQRQMWLQRKRVAKSDV